MSELDALWELADREEAAEILVRQRARADRRAAARAYAAEHREEAAARQRAYYAAHREEIAARNHARYVAKKKGTSA